MRCDLRLVLLLWLPAGVCAQENLPLPSHELEEYPQIREIEIYQGTLAYKARPGHEQKGLVKPVTACKPFLLVVRLDRPLGMYGHLDAYVTEAAGHAVSFKLRRYAFAEGDRHLYRVDSIHQAGDTILCHPDHRPQNGIRATGVRIQVSTEQFGLQSPTEEVSVPLFETPPLKIVFVPIHDGAITSAEAYIAGIKDTFPISHVNAKIAPSIGRSLDATNQDNEALLEEIKELREKEYPDAYVQGIFSAECGNSIEITKCGLAYSPGRSSIAIQTAPQCPDEEAPKILCPRDTYLHELGHNFGLRHPLDEEVPETMNYPYVEGRAGAGLAFSFSQRKFIHLPLVRDLMAVWESDAGFLSDYHRHRVARRDVWRTDEPAAVGKVVE